MDQDYLAFILVTLPASDVFDPTKVSHHRDSRMAIGSADEMKRSAGLWRSMENVEPGFIVKRG